MDPLSLTCNVAGVLTVAAQLISVGYSCGSSIAEAPGEVQELIQELTSLSGILSVLKSIIDQPPLHRSMNTQPLLIAEFLSGPLGECEERLQSLLESLRSQEVGSRAGRIFKRLTWPLKESDTKDLFARLERYKQLFSLAISADEMTLKRSICNDIGEVTRHQTIETEKNDIAIRNERFLKIVRWVSPADSEINHVTARQLQQAGTGKWFTEGRVYRNWLLPDNSFLWLYGKPGAGKTVLSSIIIDSVMSEVYTSSNTDPAVIYFYYDFKDTLKQTAASLLGSLISQLVRKKSKIPGDLENLYNGSGDGVKPPDVHSLEECLHSIIKGFSKVVVIVDAFDECVERVTVFERLERLRKNTNLLVTSRNELDIKLQFEALPNLLINSHDVSVDIKTFVTHELVRQPRLNRLKPETKSDIITALVNGASGMFRWAKCCLDEIAKLRSNKAIKSALKSLPRTLESSYERILCNIPEEDKILAIRVFKWLLSSPRPLKVREVVDAIAVEVGDVSMDPDSKLNDPEDITNICGSLVDLNRQNMTLGLAHFTVKEYLTSTSIAQGPAAVYQIQYHTASIELLKTCLTYILFDDFSTGPCRTKDEFIARLEEYPLLRYAREYWEHHLRIYQSEVDTTLNDLILRFFRLELNSGKFLFWQQATGEEYHTLGERGKYRSSMIPLGIAVETAQLPAVKDLLERGAGVNATIHGIPPLVIAAGKGHLHIVRFLLNKGAGQGHKEGYNPLCEPLVAAAKNGFPECVRLLLDHFPDSMELSEWVRCCDQAVQALHLHPCEAIMGVILATDYYKRAPTIEEFNDDDNCEVPSLFLSTFYLCLHHGWEKHIHSLWEIGSETIISVRKNWFLIGCLHEATIVGQVKPLKMILQNGNAKLACAKFGLYSFLLQEAVYYCQDRVVDFFLGLREICGDESMGLSLHIAAAKGQVCIIERLLRAGANPIREDYDGWSPLVYASQYKEDSAREKLSSFVNSLEALDIKDGPTSWNLRPEKASVDGQICLLERLVRLILPDSLDCPAYAFRYREDFASGRLLSFTNSPEAPDIKNGPTSWCLYPEGACVDGRDIKAKTDISTITLRPINHFCVNYSFEVEIVEGPCDVIGLGDLTYSRTLQGEGDFMGGPGKSHLSWGYFCWGKLNFADSMFDEEAEKYGAGDVVGCHLDKTRSIAFFTLNGKITGKPIANVKGKLVPMIKIGKGACIRTNFGDDPFIYPMPNLSAEVLSGAWKAYNEFWGKDIPDNVLA